jgi:hypothetical protein
MRAPVRRAQEKARRRDLRGALFFCERRKYQTGRFSLRFFTGSARARPCS